MAEYRVALAGNPNVGKSTLFNALTGRRQHTGNWTGKTVEGCEGVFVCREHTYSLSDLPGAYSLSSFSREETVTRRALLNTPFDCVVLVLDAGLLERNLYLALEVLSVCRNAVVCLNLMDEARKKGLIIDTKALSDALGVPVIRCCAAKKQGLSDLQEMVEKVCTGAVNCRFKRRWEEDIPLRAKAIADHCVQRTENKKQKRDRRLDRLMTSKCTGIPLILLLCGVLFWLTIVGANAPSRLLSACFAAGKEQLWRFCDGAAIPSFFSGIMIDGVYTTFSWVVAVMLPPMAIFFPLFALLEDAGILPRIAFDLDRAFSRCGAHGKQSLCMMMGLGCNACGVTGSRIIESDKERLIAVLTNNLMPCNGRFPMLIALLTLFFAGQGAFASVKTALLLLLVMVLCVIGTLVLSKGLSLCLHQKSASGFALELPPYRKPPFFKTVARSFTDKTLPVLGRAAVVAAPAGALIWLLANTHIGDASVLSRCTEALDPFGRWIGLDGTVVMALILGFPANETVIPLMLMGYLAEGQLVEMTDYPALLAVLTQNGWTRVTAVCMIIMITLRFPCSTTCLTIQKETGSVKWTLLAVVIPTVPAVLLCALAAHLF